MLPVQTKPGKALDVSVFEHRATRTYGRVKKSSTHSRDSHVTIAEIPRQRATHMDMKFGGRWSWAGHSGEEKTKIVHMEQYKVIRLDIRRCGEELHRLYGLTDLVPCMCAKRIKWAGNVARQYNPEANCGRQSREKASWENQGTDGKTKCRTTPPNCSVRKTGALRQDTRVMGGKIRGGHGQKTDRRIIRRKKSQMVFFSLRNSNHLTRHKIDSEIDR